jgi:signal transduction histidine kinase
VIEAIQAFVSWPLAASMAAVLTAQGLRAGRRRSAINEALHELRRPLQAIALGSGPELEGGTTHDSVRLAAAALQRLEREVNGEPAASASTAVACGPLLRSAVERWKARAALGGASLELRWRGGEATVLGDRTQLAQALDNLIVNAIEHGGPSIVVDAHRRAGDRLRVSVNDSGRATRPESRRESPAEVIARLRGRHRHGHGLSVVRRAAADHGGHFALRRSEQGSVAVLELPLSAAAGMGVSMSRPAR